MSSTISKNFDKAGVESSGRVAELSLAFESEWALILNQVATNVPLADVVKAAFSTGGKRLRPLVSLSITRDLTGQHATAMPAALAIECLHLASLIHDDLPALDNDDFRRGQPTMHRRFGEAKAILAGDYLVPFGLYHIATSRLLEPSIVKDLIEVLCETYQLVCQGQELDLRVGESRGDIDQLYFLKTGTLFAAAFEAGVICSQGSNQLRQIAHEIGLSVGFCFQILDDLKDLYGSPSERGRPESSDLKNNKVTYLSLHGPELAQAKLSEVRNRSMKLWAEFGRVANAEQGRDIDLSISSEFISQQLISQHSGA